ncbi:MAG: MarR family transcriptional regulator [Syntrophomonadaceae bacterium]|nr:MarR family transcriptional regulator [Syntrophomonadaceae bacterium]
MDENITPALEDYLEVILQLSEENGRAKISDIARRLNIAKPSVTQAVNNLR